MHKEQWSISTPNPYCLKLTTLSHGWVNLDPYSWEESTETLQRLEYVEGQEMLVKIMIMQDSSSSLSIKALSEKPLLQNTKKLLSEKIRRALNLDFNTRNVCKVASCHNPEIARLIKAGGGRFLRGTTLFEDVVKTLFTTNASWKFTQKMVQNIIKSYGREGAFPSPDDLKGISESKLRDKIRLGYRAKYLLNIIELFLTNRFEVHFNLNKVHGLGNYGMSHAKVLAGIFSEIPIDSEVRSYCRSNFLLETDKEIKEMFAHWGKYAFLGYKLGRQARKANWIGQLRNK